MAAIENEIFEPSEIIKVQHLVNGEWYAGSGPQVDIESPFFGKVVGSTSEADSKLIEKCITTASTAQIEWAKCPLKERTQILFKFREILLARANEISHTVSLECGKTHAEAFAGLLKGIEVLEFALSVQNIDAGGEMQVSRGVSCKFRRRPLGVVASITPFNFPAMVPMWTIPNALVMGNAYVWKPSEKTPLTSGLIGSALIDAGIPSGVFSILQGGKSVVDQLLEHERVKAVAFVGSSAVAESIYHIGSNNNKRVLALGGAKNHIVLLPDARLKMSGQGICDSFTGCAGQRCMAASVLLAVGDVQAHIDAIKERASAKVIGSDMGAIITREQQQFLSDAIDRAVEQGASIILDGREVRPPEKYAGGFWMGPTILDNVAPDSEAATKELFGPVLSIIRCSSVSEAMKIENASDYGNACSVFTSSADMADRVLSQAGAGMLGVNIGVPVPREPFSFAGIGKSKFGCGEITGLQSLDFWTDMQKITFKWELQDDKNWMS